jgi:hypothetical protein
MKLWRYIQGSRRGIEAHRIEKEAMKDPFLADALEGYEKMPGNHQRKATRLQKEITRRQQRITNKSANRKTNPLKVWGIAAALFIVAGAGAWFLSDHTPVGIINHTPIDSLSLALPVEVVPEEAPPVVQVIDEAEKKEAPKKVERVPEKPVTVEEAKVVPVAPDTSVVRETVTQTAVDTVEKEPVAAIVENVPTPSEEAMPEPVVGMQAYMDYIQRNTKQPTDEECRDVKGAVVVKFKIGQSGRPYNIRVTEGLCSSINKEAIRLIIHGPDWKKGHTSDEATITIPF